jgi:flagellar motor protein MotB
MSRRALAALAAALLLAACAGRLTSTLGTAPPPASAAGTPTVAVAPSAVEDAVQGLERELVARIARRDWAVPIQLARTGPVLRLRVGAPESFAPDGAQLRPEALLFYAEVAEVLRAAPSFVLHVIGHGDDAPGEEPATGLSSRRAATVASYLRSRGASAARLRAEGRAAREPLVAASDAGAAANRRIELVFRPVVAGAEPAAWMPPEPPVACSNCP